MDKYVTLLGAENVHNAGHSMSAAAADFRQSVGYLIESLHQHRMAMDDWLARFQTSLEEHREAQAAERKGEVG